MSAQTARSIIALSEGTDPDEADSRMLRQILSLRFIYVLIYVQNSFMHIHVQNSFSDAATDPLTQAGSGAKQILYILLIYAQNSF